MASKSATRGPPEPIYTFLNEQTEVHSLAFLLNSEEEKLLVGAADGQVYVWDFETRRRVHQFAAGSSPCLSLLTPCDGRLVTHCRGEAVVSWVRTGDGSWKIYTSLPAPGLEFCAAQLVSLGSGQAVAYPEGASLAVTETSGSSQCLRLRPDKALGHVMGLCGAGPDRVMAVFETGALVVWDLRSPSKPLCSTSLAAAAEEDYAAMCVAFDSGTLRGVVGSSAASLAAFSLDGAHVTALANTSLTNPGVASAVFRGDGKLLATAGWDSRVRLFCWRPSGLRPLAVLESHTGAGLQSVAFSPAPVEAWESQGLLAAAGKTGTVTLWDVYNH